MVWILTRVLTADVTSNVRSKFRFKWRWDLPIMRRQYCEDKTHTCTTVLPTQHECPMCQRPSWVNKTLVISHHSTSWTASNPTTPPPPNAKHRAPPGSKHLGVELEGCGLRRILAVDRPVLDAVRPKVLAHRPAAEHLAVGETVILLALPLHHDRNADSRKRGVQQNHSLADG